MSPPCAEGRLKSGAMDPTGMSFGSMGMISFVLFSGPRRRPEAVRSCCWGSTQPLCSRNASVPDQLSRQQNSQGRLSWYSPYYESMFLDPPSRTLGGRLTTGHHERGGPVAEDA